MMMCQRIKPESRLERRSQTRSAEHTMLAVVMPQRVGAGHTVDPPLGHAPTKESCAARNAPY